MEPDRRPLVYLAQPSKRRGATPRPKP